MEKTQLTFELLSVKIFKCHHCAAVLGATTENFLFVGAVRFYKHQTFDCAICNKGNFWKPANETLKKNK